MIKFLWQNIVCRFGLHQGLISDNGTRFAGAKVGSWCEGLGIKQLFTSVGNPQANGQIEVTNRTILQHLKTRLGKRVSPSYVGISHNSPCFNRRIPI